MKVGPRYKVCRRLGNDVHEKCQTDKYALSESRKKTDFRGRRPKRPSDYGKQLIEKQRVRVTYNITERQFSAYVRNAAEKHGKVDPKEQLYQNLETRLDNVAYRLGFAHTRPLARQMTTHGHLTVNGRRVNVPSYKLQKGDIVGIREGSKKKILFAELNERLQKFKTPDWLKLDTKKMEGTVDGMPTLEKTDMTFNLTSILEFYSR